MSQIEFDLLLEQADAQAWISQWQDTLDALTRAAGQQPDPAGGGNDAGASYAPREQLPAAAAAREKALECTPEQLPAWKNLAELCLQEDQLDEGIDISALLARQHLIDLESLTHIAPPDHPPKLAALNGLKYLKRGDAPGPKG